MKRNGASVSGANDTYEMFHRRATANERISVEDPRHSLLWLKITIGS